MIYSFPKSGDITASAALSFRKTLYFSNIKLFDNDEVNLGWYYIHTFLNGICCLRLQICLSIWVKSAWLWNEPKDADRFNLIPD